MRTFGAPPRVTPPGPAPDRSIRPQALNGGELVLAPQRLPRLGKDRRPTGWILRLTGHTHRATEYHGQPADQEHHPPGHSHETIIEAAGPDVVKEEQSYC